MRSEAIVDAKVPANAGAAGNGRSPGYEAKLAQHRGLVPLLLAYRPHRLG